MGPNPSKEGTKQAVVFALAVDIAAVAAALAGARHSFRWEQAAGVAQATEAARERLPDLVVVGGDASYVVCAIETLAAEAAMADASFVAWCADATGSDVARLNAIGARVAQSSPESLRRACDDAVDERDRRAAIARLQAEQRTEAAAEALEMHGKRVVVADDDPAIVWYFADVLRSAGCDVAEAADGESALDAARRTVPDVVLSDIRMPRLNGVRMCAAMRADPILGDTPVILLSWRRDWLAEASREARAAASLTKHATPEQARACVRGALAAHAKLERRLREPGPARGRLEDVAPYRILRAVCEARRDVRVTLRDATHLYEIRVREGAPRAAVRAASDGSVVRGEEALCAALSARAGRFSVAPERSAIERELRGTLYEQIAMHVAIARGAALVAPPADLQQSTIPMRMPGEDGGETVPFALIPRPTPTLVELPVRTVPMARRPLAAPPRAAAPPRIESTLRMATRPTAAARNTFAQNSAQKTQKQPAPARSSWRQVLRWALVGAGVVTSIALIAGVREAPAPSPAAATQPPPATTAARRAEEPVLDPTVSAPANARASRTPPTHPR
jgi:CheY-like chemotaxis protein